MKNCIRKIFRIKFSFGKIKAGRFKKITLTADAG
jgi:hypothetical protein